MSYETLKGETNMTNTDFLTKIAKSYAPYDGHEAFGEGFVAYQHGRHANPYDGRPADGVAAQAWDRGSEAAMRYARATS